MRSSLFWDVTQHKLVVTDVSGQPVGPVFRGQVVQEPDFLTIKNWTDRLSRNVGNYQSALR
jgi:hypothetical protein